jgi:hypothetical protein
MTMTSKEVRDYLHIDSKKVYYLRTHGYITGTEISPHEWTYDEDSVKNCKSHNREDRITVKEISIPPIPSGHLNCDLCDICIRNRECNLFREYIFDESKDYSKIHCDYYQHSLR